MKEDNQTVIKSVERASGEEVIFFHTNPKWSKLNFVDKIEETVKQVSDSCRISVYQGYLNGAIKFEMGISNDVTVIYW